MAHSLLLPVDEGPTRRQYWLNDFRALIEGLFFVGHEVITLGNEARAFDLLRLGSTARVVVGADSFVGRWE